ncbi:arsenate reductase (glutaredoxin) [Armatimonas sp.]|uniref:arsenate reductase (glutaredoxin) n=1 Tax=Armatimonas sp. TaxID=1872638 RepID=UPI00286C0204|nr:arsenate reductase (glutaredoxin) [Armatimonas sp.]
MNVTIYHNPACSKSRATLTLLRERGIEPVIRLYLHEPLTVAELEDILEKLGKSPREILRTGEEAYKTLGLSEPSLTDEQLLQALAVNPILLERPIVVVGERAALGRPPENVLELL